jgi:hypothetical protein
MCPMNWNMDIRNLTGRQITVVGVGVLAFFGLLFYLAAFKYVTAIGVIALVVIFYARWRLAAKSYEQPTSTVHRPRLRK